MDRNKTPLTENITNIVALWLDGKGFKPVETEVGVERGWVADVAGVCVPTQTEFIELRLIGRPPRGTYGLGVTDEQREAIHAKYAAWKLAYEALPDLLTCLVEVKTSVGDYRGDRKWLASWPTSLCYVARPEGMIPKDKWPAGWGIILCSQEGTTIRRVIPPAMTQAITPAQHLNVVLSLAVARDHKTRYARLREMQKTHRVVEGERKTVSRISDAIRFVRAVMGGRPVEDAMRSHGIRAKLPSYVLEDLQQLVPATPAPV